MSSIPEQRREIETRLKEHDARRKLIVAELKYLRDVCPHPNLQEWKTGYYDGSTALISSCDDCGYRHET